MTNLEIEIQVNVEKINKLKYFLKHNGKLLSDDFEKDEYFTPAHKNYLDKRPVQEWLRIRKSNSGDYITYKYWHYEGDKSSHCGDEQEVKIDNAEDAKKIFDSLGFRSLIVVDKKRQNWRFEDYKISIDKVDGLGDFVEIEFIGKAGKLDSERIAKEMIDFLKKLDCGKLVMNTKGYPYLLLLPEDADYREV